VDQRASPLALEVGQSRHRAVHLPQEVDFDDMPELLGCGLLQRRKDGDGRDVHPGVEPPVRLHRRIGNRLHLLKIRRLRGNGSRLAAVRPDLLD
jgi:hypothetical protein